MARLGYRLAALCAVVLATILLSLHLGAISRSSFSLPLRLLHQAHDPPAKDRDLDSDAGHSYLLDADPYGKEDVIPSPPDNGGPPHTRVPNGAHVSGFTVLDNVYLRNGTFYLLTSDQASLPARNVLLSLPLDLKADSKDMTPGDQELQFIRPEDAEGELWTNTEAATMVPRIEGLSVIVYDTSQFMHHYYHWFGEIILGFWRVYSHLLLENTGTNVKPAPLAFPNRFIIPFVQDGHWRDRAGVDGPLMRAAFPGAAIEDGRHWKDLADLGTTVMFERVVLVNRKTAHNHPFGSVWYKMIAGAMNVSVPENYWAPVRESMWRNLGLEYDNAAQLDSYQLPAPRLPLVTYISRQGSGRRLAAADHDALVAALYALEAEGLCEVRVAAMEKLSLRQQVEVAARSTIMVGVHGNGLTHQLWMPPSLRSTVIEIFVPKGYVFDYEILARNMGHRHYAVWNDTFLTFEKGTWHKGVNYPQGFHGTDLPVHGPTVADIIRGRLAEADPEERYQP